jgi:hypothetical protein
MIAVFRSPLRKITRKTERGRTNQGSQSRNDSMVVRPHSIEVDSGRKKPVNKGWT